MKTKNEVEQPKRRNKLGEWLDAQTGPVIEVLDWRAVNRWLGFSKKYLPLQKTFKNLIIMKATEMEQSKKRQNKIGEWLHAHPGGILDYVDWKAVMKWTDF